MSMTIREVVSRFKIGDRVWIIDSNDPDFYRHGSVLRQEDGCVDVRLDEAAYICRQFKPSQLKKEA